MFGRGIRQFLLGGVANAPAVSPELPIRRPVGEYIHRFDLPTFPVLHNGWVAPAREPLPA